MLGQMQIAPDGSIQDKVETAIRRIRAFEPPDGYFVAFSGGKDSQAIYHLCKMAGVRFDAHYSPTSVDPPELIYFIREHYPDVIWDYKYGDDGHRLTMWSLIVAHKTPPTRKARYCCTELKESSGVGRLTMTGVRWAESKNRAVAHGTVDFLGKPATTKKVAEEFGAVYRTNKTGGVVLNDDNDPNRRMVEQCFRTHKTILNPIVDWEEEDVWAFLDNIAGVSHCCLYDEGFRRLGCIGCPLSNIKQRKKDFERWPKFKKLYEITFDRMLKARTYIARTNEWWTVEDVMQWWMQF